MARWPNLLMLKRLKFALCFVLAVTCQWAAASTPALDHQASADCSAQCSGTPATVSVSFTATAGTHMIVQGTWCHDASCATAISTSNVSGISDGSNTFIQKILTAADANVGRYLYEVTSATGGTNTITLTFAGGVAIYYATILVDSWTNLASGDAFDQSGEANNTTANASCATSGNLGQSNELVLGMLNNGGQTATHGSGFTAINAPETGTLDEYEIGGSSGSTVTATFSSTAATWACQVSTFKAGGAAYTASPSESNPASDRISRLATFRRADSETKVASDAIARQVSSGRGDSESNTASDLISRDAGFGRGDSETNTASDSLARSATFGRGDTETNIASDTVARLASFGRGDSETNVASDLIARSGVFGLVDNESNTAADSIARSQGLSRGDSETNVASDGIARSAKLGRGDSEANMASDSIARSGAFGRGDNESNTAADSIARSQGLSRGDSETNVASDGIAR
ncbi:MAG: hypothetical protein WCD04_07225, partial [Terriglobia bacterium]